MYKLSFYVPPSHLEIVKDALFEIGAGNVGKYKKCCFQILGEGQFCPMEGSNPHIGTINQLEKVNEYRVELVVSATLIQKAIRALKASHPYEEPAYDIIKLEAY